MTPVEAAPPSSPRPGAVVLRGAFPEDTGPIGSVAHALQRALRLPGAEAVTVGELGLPHPLAWAELPYLDSDFAVRHASGPVALARLLELRGEAPEELVVSASARLSLLRTLPLPGGGPAYIQLTLARGTSNLALAGLGLRSLAAELPRILAGESGPGTPPARARLPRRPRGEAVTVRKAAPERAEAVPLSTIQQVLERLRLL